MSIVRRFTLAATCLPARSYGFNMRCIKELAMAEPLVDSVEHNQVGEGGVSRSSSSRGRGSRRSDIQQQQQQPRSGCCDMQK